MKSECNQKQQFYSSAFLMNSPFITSWPEEWQRSTLFTLTTVSIDRNSMRTPWFFYGLENASDSAVTFLSLLSCGRSTAGHYRWCFLKSIYLPVM